jgi:hypothetical protein
MGDSAPVAQQHNSRFRTEARITRCLSTIRHRHLIAKDPSNTGAIPVGGRSKPYSFEGFLALGVVGCLSTVSKMYGIGLYFGHLEVVSLRAVYEAAVVFEDGHHGDACLFGEPGQADAVGQGQRNICILGRVSAPAGD